MCIPLDPHPELWLLFVTYFFVIMERCNGVVEGRSRSEGQNPVLVSFSIAHGFPDSGQGTSPEPQPYHLKSRDGDTCLIHLAGLWEASGHIKYLKALSKSCSPTWEILMKTPRPLHLPWVLAIFLFSWPVNSDLNFSYQGVQFLTSHPWPCTKVGRQKMESSAHHDTTAWAWRPYCILGYSAGVVCGPFPGTLLMPLWVQIPLVQSLSYVHLFATPWTAACQVSLTFTISQSLLNSCLLSQWCHPTILSSVVPFSSPHHHFWGVPYLDPHSHMLSPCFPKVLLQRDWVPRHFQFPHKITLSPWDFISSRTHPVSPVCLHLPCCELPFGVPAILSC